MSDARSGEGFACIWDMDGVLIDSMNAHFVAWQRLGREIGREFTWEHQLKSLGLVNRDILRDLLELNGPDEEMILIGERKEVYFRESARGLVALPGADALVRGLHAAGWRQAVGSSGPSANVEILIDVLGLSECFEAVVTGSDITHGKPHPEIFSTGMRRLGVPPSKSIVVEDATSGVKAGKAAGAFVVGVMTSRTREDLAEAGADLVVASLEDLDPQRMLGLIARSGIREG